MQRPETRKPHYGKAQDLAATREALAIGVTEHEAGQGKEHVDAKLQVRERADVLQCMVNRNMEKYDQQRANAAQCIKCLKPTRNGRRVS